MQVQQFCKTTGYKKWQRHRLGHTMNKDVQDTIKHVIEMEELLLTTYEKYTKDASCILLKIFLEKRSGQTVHQNKSTLSHLSIEGYFHAVVIVVCRLRYRWLYCMRIRDEMLQVVKRWYSDIADLRQKHTLVVAMQDNAEEIQANGLLEFSILWE